MRCLVLTDYWYRSPWGAPGKEKPQTKEPLLVLGRLRTQLIERAYLLGRHNV